MYKASGRAELPAPAQKRKAENRNALAALADVAGAKAGLDRIRVEKLGGNSKCEARLGEVLAIARG